MTHGAREQADSNARPSPANVAGTLLWWAVLTLLVGAFVVFGFGAIVATAIFDEHQDEPTVKQK